jgi:hypothetical protein
MSPFKRSGNAESRSTERYFSSSVSNVPADVSDEDALTGAWRARKARPKTAEELDEETVWNLRRGIGKKIF